MDREKEQRQSGISGPPSTLPPAAPIGKSSIGATASLTLYVTVSRASVSCHHALFLAPTQSNLCVAACPCTEWVDRLFRWVAQIRRHVEAQHPGRLRLGGRPHQPALNVCSRTPVLMRVARRDARHTTSWSQGERGVLGDVLWVLGEDKDLHVCSKRTSPKVTSGADVKRLEARGSVVRPAAGRVG